MAFEDYGRTQSFTAGTSFASKQYTFVKMVAGALQTPSAGADAIGVIQDNPASGSPGAVVTTPGDRTKIRTGEAFAADSFVSTDGNGAAVAVATGEYVLGQAVTASSGAGDLITIVFKPAGKVA